MGLLRLSFWTFRLFGKLFLTLLLLGAIALILYTSFWLPDVSLLRQENPQTTSFMELSKRKAEERGERLKVFHHPVTLENISPELAKAVRIGEDDRFYLHNGFDFTEIRSAVEENYEAGKWVRGASTLSQQLAKNLYLSPEKTLSRKFDEMLLTWKIEQSLSKDRILELYLNYVDWGHGCFGAEAASRFYFSKPALKLNAREAAYLAALLPNPEYMGSHSGESRRKERERIILDRMRNQKTAPGRDPERDAIAPVAANKVESVEETPVTWSGRFSSWSSSAKKTLAGWLLEDQLPVEVPALEPSAPKGSVEPASQSERPLMTQRVLQSLESIMSDKNAESSPPMASVPPRSVPVPPRQDEPVQASSNSAAPAPAAAPVPLTELRRRETSPVALEGPASPAVAPAAAPAAQPGSVSPAPQAAQAPAPAEKEAVAETAPAPARPAKSRLLEKLAHLESAWNPPDKVD
jgi:monofunctional biosynthetic peptidoglycan transglycosylase